MLNYKYNLKELVEMLQARSEIDAFVVDIFKFNLICDESFGIEEMLFDAHISTESKLKYLEHVLKDQLGPAFYAFLVQLIKNNDINYYEFISKKFITLLSQEKNCTYIEIVSAIPLLPEQLKAIKEQIVRMLQKEVYIYNSVSKKVIGGFIVNCGERMLDLSVQGALEQFKVQLARV